MNKYFSADKMVFGLFGLIWLLGVNKKSSSKEIMKGSWDKINVRLINDINKLTYVKINEGN